jgi:acyl-coenzyme A synthetase/AMP-(fatty) acid ligase
MSVGVPFLGGGSLVARQHGKLIERGKFLGDIENLAEQLPDRPCVVNFCADRYRFTVAWAAAMLRAQVTLLPGSRDAAAVQALRADYPELYVLVDDEADDSPGPRFAYPKLVDTGSRGKVPAFPTDQVAAVLFTSGSTGRPNPSPRRWGRLVAGARAAGVALGLQRYPGAALVATVPHAHSYGLESAVMLPLQHGLLLTADRPFFPADVAAALEGEQPGILVTTPVHLRALVGDAVAAEPGPGFGASVRAGFVLSATAPLSADLAARAETAFGAPVFEIYGCSEAGQLATRRTVDGPVWRCLAGFRLHQDSAGTWASGPDEDDVLLADEIELANAGDFILMGRTADMVNVAGKRSSLAYLTRQLIAIDGVEDGVFLRPEDDAVGAPAHDATRAPARLAAVVVAPGIAAATILAALRQRIDPAFLPRPLHVVDTLPRDALGKLPRSETLRLLGAVAALSPELAAASTASAEPVAAAPESAVSVATLPLSADPVDVLPASADPAVADPVLLCFPTDHPAGPGHFPGNPIVPGAVLLDALVSARFPGGWSGEIQAAKFHHPVRPGDTIAVTFRTEGSATRFECRLTGSEQLVLSGALRAAFPSR